MKPYFKGFFYENLRPAGMKKVAYGHLCGWRLGIHAIEKSGFLQTLLHTVLRFSL